MGLRVGTLDLGWGPAGDMGRQVHSVAGPAQPPAGVTGGRRVTLADGPLAHTHSPSSPFLRTFRPLAHVHRALTTVCVQPRSPLWSPSSAGWSAEAGPGLAEGRVHSVLTAACPVSAPAVSVTHGVLTQTQVNDSAPAGPRLCDERLVGPQPLVLSGSRDAMCSATLEGVGPGQPELTVLLN